jgi:hypothetical protein
MHHYAWLIMVLCLLCRLPSTLPAAASCISGVRIILCKGVEHVAQLPRRRCQALHATQAPPRTCASSFRELLSRVVICVHGIVVGGPREMPTRPPILGELPRVPLQVTLMPSVHPSTGCREGQCTLGIPKGRRQT